MAARTVFLSGASSGIGRALAVSLASRGAHLALAARRRDLLLELAADVERAGGRALVLPVDVCDATAIKEAVLRADHELGTLDMVIANAGVGHSRHATRLTWDDVQQVIDVNVRGAMATLMAAIPVMMLHKKGHLVGVTSLAGRRGLPGAGAYSASKAALSTFLETLRVDLRPSGIRVTDVQPGFVETAMTAKNAFPMPFMWPVDRAAEHIARRLEKAPPVIAFPLPMDLVTRLARNLPAWLYDAVMRSGSPRMRG